jgi:hypothetical protein
VLELGGGGGEELGRGGCVMRKQGEENGMLGMGSDLAHDSAFAYLLFCIRYYVMVVVQVHYQRTNIIYLGFLERRYNFSQTIFKVQMW